MKHKQLKANLDPMAHHDIQNIPDASQALANSVVVDPSLETEQHALHVADDSLDNVHNGLGDAMGDPEADHAAYSANILNMPYNTNQFLRSSFSFVNGNTGATATTSAIGQEAEGDVADNPMRSNEALMRASPSSEPDSSDPQYRSVRLPPILQVEKQHVTTTATQAASATRRKNEAVFKCPVPGCGSTFTRRFNLRGHLRSHTEERPFVCEWPGCGKGFARSHDCKRHTALHTAKHGAHVCAGCGKTFSRTDALNRHLKSEVGAGCRDIVADAQAHQSLSRQASAPPIADDSANASPSASLSQLDIDSGLRPVPFAL